MIMVGVARTGGIDNGAQAVQSTCTNNRSHQEWQPT